MVDTTIRVNKETKSSLDSFKEYKSESSDEILRKLIFIAESADEKPEVAQETMKEIRAARDKIRNSGRYSEEEKLKILGEGNGDKKI